MKRSRSRQRQIIVVGNSRDPKKTFLPEHVVEGLENLAASQHKTFSRIMAEIVYDYFDLDESGFIAKGTSNAYSSGQAGSSRIQTTKATIRSAGRRVERVASENILRFEKRRSKARAS